MMRRRGVDAASNGRASRRSKRVKASIAVSRREKGERQSRVDRNSLSTLALAPSTSVPPTTTLLAHTTHSSLSHQSSIATRSCPVPCPLVEDRLEAATMAPLSLSTFASTYLKAPLPAHDSEDEEDTSPVSLISRLVAPSRPRR